MDGDPDRVAQASEAPEVDVLEGDVVYPIGFALGLGVLALRLGPWRTLVALVALAHLTILASVALFPIPLDAQLLAEGRAAAAEPYSAYSLNLVPFRTIGPWLTGGANAMAISIAPLNLFVLTPAGIYLPLLFRRLRGGWAFAPVALVGGASIELAQLGVSLALGFRYRSIDVDDVILNTIGLLIGYAAARAGLAGWDALTKTERMGALVRR